MIIFDLDGTLADCEHRRHFINPPENVKFIYEDSVPHENGCILTGNWYEYESNKIWKPDWQSFYEACDVDEPIEPVVNVFRQLHLKWPEDKVRIEIWSGRCESVREKTLKWIKNYLKCCFNDDLLKMRPIGDDTPLHELKERWLNEYNLNLYPPLKPMSEDGIMDESIFKRKDPINFVFDSDKKSIEMWRRRGIFVFNCFQGD